MEEQHLKERGITIEPFVHRHGSPYGQYWGYIVAHQNGDEHPTLYGKQSSGKTLPLDPFAHRQKAFAFAVGLAEQNKDEEDNHDFDHDDPWIDIGGEG